MQNKIVTLEHLKSLLDKFFSNPPEEGFYEDVMSDYEDAFNNGCKYALLTFNDDGEVHWDFLKDIKLCDDPNCSIEHSKETDVNQETFQNLLENQ
jgi:hypothetical protein